MTGIPHPEGGEEAGDGVFVADRDAVLAVGADRGELVVVVAVAHHGAAEGELDEVVGGPVAAGAGAPEGGDAAPDAGVQVRLGCGPLPAAAEGVEEGGAGGVDHDVDAADQPLPDLEAGGLGDVEGDGAFAGVTGGVEQGGLTGVVVNEGADMAAAAAAGRFDADDVGAGVGEQLAGDLAAVANLEHAQGFEWAVAGAGELVAGAGWVWLGGGIRGGHQMASSASMVASSSLS